MFGFTWRVDGLPEDDPRRTYVEFTLEPDGDGHAPARGRDRASPSCPTSGYRNGFESHTEGWRRELGELVAYLDAAVQA